MNPTPEPTDRAEVTKLAAAVDDALAEVMLKRYDNPDLPSWKDGPRIGDAPPVTDQPGTRRAPMSQGAVDYCARVLSTSVATAMGSGSIALVLTATHYANPTVCAIVFCAPVGLAVPIAALSGLLSRAKRVVEAAPQQVTNNYNGSVYQDQRQSSHRTIGVIATAIDKD